MKITLIFAFTFLIPGIATCQDEIPLKQKIKLPEPRKESNYSFEKAVEKRRSIRSYTKDSLSLEEISQLLWAAQGITGAGWLRASPSAGALYPLELYVIVGAVKTLPAGVYQYKPKGHKLVLKKKGDLRNKLHEQSLQQSPVKKAAVCIVIAGVYERTTKKYRERGKRYVHMEVGHACQNIYLQATALDLGTVTIGAFQDKEVQKILGMSSNERPFSIMPVGKVK